MAEQIVLIQGLFDQEQGELVELGEVADISSPVRGVCVHLQHQVAAEAFPDRLQRCQVPTRLDLELDPPVPGVEILGHRVEQSVDRAHEADSDTGCHCVGDTTQEGAERDARHAELCIQHCHLQGGLRHAVAPELTQERPNVGGSELRHAQ